MKTKKLIITTAPLIAVVIVLLLKKYILGFAQALPECKFREITSFMCVGCGNTRAIISMLSFDFISALKYNITFPVLVVFLVLLYLQYVITAWIKPVRLLPKNIAFYVILAVIFVIYFIARNFAY